MWLRDCRVRLVGSILLGLVSVYIAYWLLQSPVPSGMYPARVGGTYYSTDSSPTYDLPIIWVRQFPWSKTPPTLNHLALITSDGERAITGGNWQPRMDWNRDLPVWLQPRAITGHVYFHYHKEGLQANGMTWQLAGEEKKLFRTGEITLAWTDTEYHGVYSSGFTLERDDCYGIRILANDLGVVGHYIMVSGSTRLLDIIPSTAGSEHPIEGLVYRRGRSSDHLHYSDPEYQPLALPLQLTHEIVTIYMPLSETARARLADTLYYFCPALVVEDWDGVRQVSTLSVRGWGWPGDGWRAWVPFFIYESEPIQ